MFAWLIAAIAAQLLMYQPIAVAAAEPAPSFAAEVRAQDASASASLAAEAPSQPAPAALPDAAGAPRIAIVIDDFGNGMKGTEEMLGLGFPITAAVMPFLPTTQRDAERAHQLGYDVIVHLPMEPIRGKKSWLGPGAITTDLSDEEIRRRVEEAITNVPHAIGMNNHMGSKATADSRVMRIVMQVCHERGLFFLDSRTNYRSKAEEEALAAQVPLLKNNIFLDEVYSSGHVRKQMKKVLEHAQKEETTIVIGHVGPPGQITAGVLKAAAAELQSAGKVVRLSELLRYIPYPALK